MKQFALMLLALCLLLGGCSKIFEGSYYHVEPHQNQNSPLVQDNIMVSNYVGLCSALIGYVESGVESGLIFVPNYDQTYIGQDIPTAINHVMTTNPIAAWAVEDITCEPGSSGGQHAVAVSITYTHDRTEIRKIHRVTDAEGIQNIISGVLTDFGTGVVMLLPADQALDYAQYVDSYADTYPQTVIEKPQVVVNIYPDSGYTRLVELKFTYQTNRDSLRTMQDQVHSVFESAAAYISSYEQEAEKYQRLYYFLMEFLIEGDYQLETSITPAYSLLRHGVGDKKAFATVFAAMCRESGLDCQVVSGTRGGEAWYWNLIAIDGEYSHLDLLRCRENGKFAPYSDEEMDGYVWDYSAFPVAS
ncbi:MAG: transglutaminase domain-containing protein [Ruminococcaceae bacterium]|nr:transglutaminase domain-containing protein [Oscillospiraceae bacterium]